MIKKKTPPRGYCKKSLEKRIQWLKESHGIDYQYSPLAQELEDYQGLAENIVSGINIPISIASPLLINNGDHIHGNFAVPLATLEGTLVLSMTRGMYTTALSGGIETIYCGQQIARAPVFQFATLKDARCFAAWVKDHFLLLKEAAEKTTRFGKLISADAHIIHDNVIIDCVYTTGDAAGQNMITIATQALQKTILARTDIPKPIRHYVESNFSGDKNSAWRNITLGRGHKAIARACINEKILKRVMHVSKQEITSAYYVKQDASLLAGVSGSNMHTANALTAIYLATGQDAACATENSNSIIRYEITGDDLVVTATLPSLTVGTVGGATRLKQQRHHLDMLGCTGEHSTKKFCQILAGCVLALEISLGAAVASNEFTEAHKQYGRK
ncbi:MAG: hydroxymethylglutaryl-CoA reductase [Pseudomonadota bacterium]